MFKPKDKWRANSKMEFFSPFIETATEFSNSPPGKTDIEGTGTALYLIQEK